MHKVEEGRAKEILHKMGKRRCCFSNRMYDSNLIRMAAIQGFKTADKNAVLLDSLLLEMEPQKVQKLVRQRPVFN